MLSARCWAAGQSSTDTKMIQIQCHPMGPGRRVRSVRCAWEWLQRVRMLLEAGGVCVKGREGLQQDVLRWGWQSWWRLQLEKVSAGGGCLTSSENLQRGSCGRSGRLKIISGFFDLQITETAQRECFAPVIRRVWEMSFRNSWIQDSLFLIPSPCPASLALASF